jgi:hypothetical protein
MELSDAHQMEFCENFMLAIFTKISGYILLLVEIRQNKEYFTCRHM